MSYLYDFTLILMKFSKFGGNLHQFNFVTVNTECRIYRVVVYMMANYKTNCGKLDGRAPNMLSD